MVNFVVKRTPSTARYFTEDLGNGIGIDMILIPGGTFLMGSPKDEEGHNSSESPQHEVTVPSFCMGRYPVTQAQWKQVAKNFPRQKRDLDANPSKFKDDNRPVERVTWYEVVEFCDRLTAKIKREYRLPSEAEWEYACRAGTTTPFYFGETISTEVANYDGNYTYGQGQKGVYRRKTSTVNEFDMPNGFGLVDMYGNVWEWCQDCWHENYKEAPTDGSAWIGNDERRILRGGSWDGDSEHCRSALRGWYVPGDRGDDSGFRLVLSLPRTS